MVVDAAEVGFAVGGGVGDHERGTSETGASGVGLENRGVERGHAESCTQILHRGNRFRSTGDSRGVPGVGQDRSGAGERRHIRAAGVLDGEDLDRGHVRT